MAIRLNLNHGSIRHRFVRLLEAKVTADGADVPQVTAGRDKSRPGALRFDVPDTAKNVTLTATIPSQTTPASGKPTPIMEVKQDFKVVADPAPPHLEPVPGFHGRYHARLMETGGTAVSKAGKARVLNLRLNVTFLNVTQHATDKERFGNPLFPTTLAMPKRTRFRLMEYTRGEPSTWMVLLPSALTLKLTKINMLLFFRPTIKAAFRNTDDVPYIFRGTRYLNEPTEPAPAFHSTDEPFFFPFPACDFERQLVQSKKPVALVYPFPHVARFGDAGNANMVPTLKELVRCLWAEDAVAVNAPTKETPVLGQLGLAGFSNGGLAALAAFANRANTNSVDELYLFDPARMDKSEAIGPWLKGKPGQRKLRMIAGGYQQDFMNAFARQLKDPANVSVLNPDPDFWYSSSLYQKALSSPNAPDGIMLFDPVGPAPATQMATKKSGLRVVSVRHDPARPARSSITLRPEFSTNKKDERTVSGVSHVEAAALVAGHIIRNFNFNSPVKTVKELDLVVKMILLNDPPDDPEKQRIKALRHEWVVVGGEVVAGFSPPEPGPRGNRFPGFKGFLQICLEQSGFTA